MASTALILHLPANDLLLDKYSTLDMSRQNNEFHINVTNNEPDLAFNALFDEIRERLGEEITFSVTVKKEKGQATFNAVAVDYHLTGQGEILHFSKPIQQQEQEQQEETAE